MDNYKQLEKTLNHIIKKMNDSRSIICENPRTDFIRSRKLDFKIPSKFSSAWKTAL